jgi:hypothetical protein
LRFLEPGKYAVDCPAAFWLFGLRANACPITKSAALFVPKYSTVALIAQQQRKLFEIYRQILMFAYSSRLEVGFSNEKILMKEKLFQYFGRPKKK